MERMTRKDEQGYYVPVAIPPMLSCHRSECVDRLAAYEDTGLTPEEVAEYKKFEDEAVGKGVPFSRIVELMEADRDGRLVVLPDVGTEWLSTWDSGATCALECPVLLDGKQHCDICEHGVLFVAQRRENFRR